jgi:hypothetical protein
MKLETVCDTYKIAGEIKEGKIDQIIDNTEIILH